MTTSNTDVVLADFYTLNYDTATNTTAVSYTVNTAGNWNTVTGATSTFVGASINWDLGNIYFCHRCRKKIWAITQCADCYTDVCEFFTWEQFLEAVGR